STPIQALSSIINYFPEKQKIGFKSSYLESWDEEILSQLKEYATTEIDEYYNRITQEGTITIEELSVSKRLQQINSFIKSKGFHYPTNMIENFFLSLKTKPFAILAGISGTGK